MKSFAIVGGILVVLSVLLSLPVIRRRAVRRGLDASLRFPAYLAAFGAMCLLLAIHEPE